MHRHGYKGKKFHRESDQRIALIQSVAESLIKHESIETTLPKAKAVVPYVERLITKAKKADLHNRRQILGSLQTVGSAHKLVDELAPKLKGRTSGHLRIEKIGYRRGDNAQLARISFVDNTNAQDQEATPDPKSSKASQEPKTNDKPEQNRSLTGSLPKGGSVKATSHVEAPKRTGKRGDR